MKKLLALSIFLNLICLLSSCQKTNDDIQKKIINDPLFRNKVILTGKMAQLGRSVNRKITLEQATEMDNKRLTPCQYLEIKKDEVVEYKEYWLNSCEATKNREQLIQKYGDDFSENVIELNELFHKTFPEVIESIVKGLVKKD